MKNKIKGQEGFSGVDIVVSIGVIIIFTSIIAAIYLNLHSVNMEVERSGKATNYAISILEKVDELYYNEVTQDNFSTQDMGNGKHSVAGIEIASGYTASVIVENYNQTDGVANGKLDVVKTVYVTVEYKVGNKTQSIEMKKIKTKENIKTPNIPKLESDMIAVKYNYTNSSKVLVKTNTNDTNWYQYENKTWALAIKNTDLQEDGSIKDSVTLYAWVPRFAYYTTSSATDIKFLYGTGNRYVNTEGNLQELTSSYQTPTEFQSGASNLTGVWVKVSDISTNLAANILNSSTKYGPITV